MLANRVDITAGTPGHRYLVERQWKCLYNHEKIPVISVEYADSATSALCALNTQISATSALYTTNFNNNSRHGLIDALDSVSHGELVDQLLARRIEVDLPGVVAGGSW